MKSVRFNAFFVIAALVLISAVVYVVRSQTGATVGIDLGAEGYVVGTGDEQRALGGNHEVIQVGDRVVTVAGRGVSSLGEIGDVLRSLSPSDGANDEIRVPLTLERRRYRFGESLNHREVQERGFPSSIETGDRVVGYDDHEVRGDIDRSTILAILANRRGQRVTFYFERPEHHYSVDLPLVEPAFPAWPVLLFAIALVLTLAIAWRSHRRVGGSGGKGAWLSLSLSTMMAPWALVLLWDPASALEDPVLLLPSLVALCLFRPLSLELHRRLFGGQTRPLVTLALLLPALVLAFVGVLLTMELGASLFGGAVEPGKEVDIIDLIRAACGMTAIYHTLDLVLWFRRSGRLRQKASSPILAPQLGLIVSSLAILSSLLFWINDPGSFIGGGFVYHAAGLILVLWLGDLALIALPPLEVGVVEERPEVSPSESSAALCDFLGEELTEAGLHGAELIVVRGRFAVVMAATRVVEEGQDEVDEDAPLSLSVYRAPEEVRAGVGLLRDEQVSLPMPNESPTGKEEHSGEMIGPVDVIRSVADNLGVGTAFSVLDEADAIESPSHAERDEAFYAWVFDYGAPNYAMDWDELQALRARFESLWPGARQLILETLLREEIAGRPRPAPRVEEKIVIERVETVKEIEPVDYRFMQRDLAESFPVDEPGLLEEDLEEALEEAAADDAPVIVVGPVGVGKEFVSRRLHAVGSYAEGPFIKFSVATCPSAVREVELFGDDHEAGHLRAASGGVLYVDDVVELGGELLDRLLKEVGDVEEPVWLILGLRSPVGRDVRAWMADLEGSLGQLCNGFLSHRVVVLQPLEERPELIEALAWHFLIELSMKHNKVIHSISGDALDELKEHPWPAGVPELRFFIERAVLRCDSEELQVDDLGEDELAGESEVASAPSGGGGGELADLVAAIDAEEDLKALFRRVRGMVYREALEREGGNKAAAARSLGVKRSTFARHLKQGREE